MENGKLMVLQTAIIMGVGVPPEIFNFQLSIFNYTRNYYESSYSKS